MIPPDDRDASYRKPPGSFDAFFAHYLRQHSRPATRALHLAGTGAATLLLLSALVNRRRRLPLLLAAPVVGYGPAWLAHFLVEQNHPATFEHLVWSFRADYRMLWLWLTGRLEAVLRQTGSCSSYTNARIAAS
jgi:hypothetical protein